MSPYVDKQVFKTKVLKLIEDFVFGLVDKRLDKQLEEIIRLNDVTLNEERFIFYYRGVKHTRHLFRGPVQHIPRLDESLHKAMDKWIDERERIDFQERPLVLGFIRKVLNSSKNISDVVLLMPDALHEPLRDMFDQLDSDMPVLSSDEVAAIVGASERSLSALKVRLMKNLLEE